MISVPEDIEPLFVRKHPFPLSTALDLEDWDATKAWLEEQRPDVIINLAGESRPDVVGDQQQRYWFINVELPNQLGKWCDTQKAHLVQVSTQAVFSGRGGGPYQPDFARMPVNAYGRQKAMAEDLTQCSSSWTIVRPTFVLGIRPFPALGRENPAEAILGGAQPWQVDNRWFSVSFAWDVAEMLWHMARLRPKGKIVHCGNPERLSRFELARLLNPECNFTPISHELLGGMFPDARLAERPIDTTFKDAYFETPLESGLSSLRRDFLNRREDSLYHRAQELSAFLKLPLRDVAWRLSSGFTELHNSTSEDFRTFMRECRSEDAGSGGDAELIDWYRQTEAYLWELTAYHCDPGFNYAGMCAGIVATLKEDEYKKCRDEKFFDSYRVLCLGDGVGSLTIALKQACLEPVYHDLAGSRTAAFAQTGFAMRFDSEIEASLSQSFEPATMPVVPDLDSVVSLDFLEHVPNVETWARVVFAALKPGGLFCAVNRFECGSAGEIPMHLAVNDCYSTEWEPLLKRIGFEQVFADDGPAADWHRKPL